MKSNEERLELIQRRVKQIKRKQAQRRQQLVGAASIGCSLILILFLGIQMPSFTKNFTNDQVEQTTAAASLIGNSMTVGYVIMGIAAFLLGVGVAALLFSLREKEQME